MSHATMSQLTNLPVVEQTDERKLISEVRFYQRSITFREVDLAESPNISVEDKNRIVREIADYTAKRDAAQAIINSLRKHN